MASISARPRTLAGGFSDPVRFRHPQAAAWLSHVRVPRAVSPRGTAGPEGCHFPVITQETPATVPQAVTGDRTRLGHWKDRACSMRVGLVGRFFFVSFQFKEKKQKPAGSQVYRTGHIR